MKRITTIILFLVMNTLFFSQVNLQAQCTNCRNSQSNHHMGSSAIGINAIATGQASFASGKDVRASGMGSTSIGNMTVADGVKAMVFGSNAKSLGQGSMVLGTGYGEESDEQLTNVLDNSLMIGFNSIYPTLFVSPSDSRTGTGKVGIGNVTEPEAQLHIRTPHGYSAGLFVEQENFRNLSFYLGNMTHGIRSTDDIGLVFFSENNYLFEKGKVGINTIRPLYDLDVRGSIFTKQLTLFDKELYKENIDGWVLCSDAGGQAYWTEPGTFNDNAWTLRGNNIYRMEGYVGIGTTQTYGYKLAVDGGVLAEEVTVKMSHDWPDYVFEEGYSLLPIQQLKTYINDKGHLPGIPAAEEIRETGLAVGKMESLLLKKIEELTLYIINQETKINALESMICQ